MRGGIYIILQDYKKLTIDGKEEIVTTITGDVSQVEEYRHGFTVFYKDGSVDTFKYDEENLHSAYLLNSDFKTLKKLA